VAPQNPDIPCHIHRLQLVQDTLDDDEETPMPTSTSSGIAPRTTAPSSAVHDFDFYMGKWHVHHRRLKERLAGSDEWEEFEGTSEAWPILGGAGNIDDNVLELPTGTYRAISLRTFEPVSDKWSIWWLDGRTPSRLDPPVVGGFSDGIGTFIAEDTFNGRRILVRFIWSSITEDTCRWEQAFSPDGGEGWEVNWVMESTRIA
jgi:hypothetical protein